MRPLIAFALVALVAGCGGTSTAPAKAATTPTLTDTPTSTPNMASLKETCAEVELALPKGAVDTYDDGKMRAFLDRLVVLNNAGDTETRNALRPLATPAAELAGGAGAEAHLAFLDALGDLAIRCKIVGSSALQ